METTVTIDKAGRVVIPKKARDRLGIGAGQSLTFKADERGFWLEPQESSVQVYMKNGLLVARGKGTITAEEIEVERQQMYRERLERAWNPDA
jgi:AbrB family looped-hinge helix DNA binding protein